MSWKSFDEIINGKHHKRAISNYYRNKSIGIKTADDKDASDTDLIAPRSDEALRHSTVCRVKEKDLLYCQYGGNFPLMKFAYANLGQVICEIMAVYDAMKLSGYIDDDSDFDEFFKIACEFEVNAPYITPTGHFGGDYRRIGDFLRSRGVDFTVCRDIDKIDAEIRSSESCVVSYRFDHVGVHSFCCYYDGDKLVSINRGSGCLYLWYDNSVNDCLRGDKLLVGYILKHKQA